MTIYDKPVHGLMRDMVADLHLEKGQILSKDRVIAWFVQHYPKIKEGTVAAHLIRLSTNARTRIHYQAKPDDDLFFQVNGSHFRLYDPENDPAPIYQKSQTLASPQEQVPEESEEPGPAGQFAYESDLRDFLAKNLSLLEPGLHLYEEDGITGVEFPVGGRSIDILAVDAQTNLVVVELKVSRGYDRVVGQLLRYMAWIATHHADRSQKVRGIIITREISEDLILASSQLSNVELYEYVLSVAFRKIQRPQSKPE